VDEGERKIRGPRWVGGGENSHSGGHNPTTKDNCGDGGKTIALGNVGTVGDDWVGGGGCGWGGVGLGGVVGCVVGVVGGGDVWVVFGIGVGDWRFGGRCVFSIVGLWGRVVERVGRNWGGVGGGRLRAMAKPDWPPSIEGQKTDEELGLRPARRV